MAPRTNPMITAAHAGETEIRRTGRRARPGSAPRRLDFAASLTILPAKYRPADPSRAFFGASDASVSLKDASRHGQGRLAQDQAAVDRRHRLFLRHQEERPHQDGEARPSRNTTRSRASTSSSRKRRSSKRTFGLRNQRAPSRAPFPLREISTLSLESGANTPAMSPMPQCSAILPSVKRKMSHEVNERCFRVGSTP